MNPVQEKAGATVNANLLTGLGIDEFFTRTDGVGVRSLLPDALGSTVALGDGTGTLQTQYTYEPFGFVSQTGAASTSSYKYTGREDDGTGLSYYRARYYQPRFQRFISEDPIGFKGGIDFYTYGLNNPLTWIDAIALAPSKRSPGNGNGKNKPTELEKSDGNRGKEGTIQPSDPIPQPAPKNPKFCERVYKACLESGTNLCPKKYQPTWQAGCFALYLACITVGGDRDGDE